MLALPSSQMPTFCFTSLLLYFFCLMRGVTELQDLPYLRESSANPFQGFLCPKNRVRFRISGALDARAKLESMILLSVGSL